MSSTYRDKWMSESENEIKELEEKKVHYGWTKKDAERYEYLLREIEKQ